MGAGWGRGEDSLGAGDSLFVNRVVGFHRCAPFCQNSLNYNIVLKARDSSSMKGMPHEVDL